MFFFKKKILDDLIFSAADSPPSLPILNNNDDISNALIDRKCLVYLKIEEFIFKKKRYLNDVIWIFTKILV